MTGPTSVCIELEEKMKKRPRPLHRVVPVSVDVHAPADHPQEWRCANCGAGPKRYPDEFDEFPCHDPLPGFET